ncbi:GNAT family N-acetyltransferase, partial [Thermodesulfobacteriota bacterium]
MDKAKDFLSLWVNLKRVLPEALVDKLRRTEAAGVRFRKFDMKRFPEEIELLRRLNNQSWTDAGNWGFVPITQAEMELISAHFKQIADPDIIYFAEVGGTTAGYVINLPNFFPALRALDGRTSPLGILRFLLRLKRIKNVRAVSVGVLEGFGGRNIALSLFVKSVLEMQKKGYESMEYVWVVEDNEASLRIVSKFGGKHYKRYRMYEYIPT